jgi:hypothetical protein
MARTQEVFRVAPDKVREARSDIANQIHFARYNDRKKNEYYTDRTGDEYLHQLCGLENVFSYVRTLPPEHRTVLDIGAGEMFGIKEIAESDIGQGISFVATNLERVATMQEGDLPFTPILTSGEVLAGIPNESVGAVISCSGIAYSKEPKFMIGRIHEVLAPGGVLKATFRAQRIFDPELCQEYERLGYQDYRRFTAPLGDLGYNIWPYIDETHDPSRDVLTAIKPGNPHAPSARELFESDKQLLQESIIANFLTFSGKAE